MFRVWHLGQHQRGLLMAAGQRDGRMDGRRVVTVYQATSAKVAPRSEVAHNPDVCLSFVCVYICSVEGFISRSSTMKQHETFMGILILFVTF